MPTSIAAKGMSEAMSELRDTFARTALPPLVTSALAGEHHSWEATGDLAYIIADAMIEAREL